MAIDQSKIDKAKKFCKAMKTEEKLRACIAAITRTLSRSNLSADEGLRHAKSLVKAYGLLKPFEVVQE